MPLQHAQTLLIVVVLAACSKTPDADHTVAYYRTHAAERVARVAECANDPGSLRNSPACVNAREAARLEDTGSLRSLPPMGLPGKPAEPPIPR